MVATLGAVFISLFTATVPDEPWEQYFLTHLPKCWVVEEDANLDFTESTRSRSQATD
jgi:hypothetical protein